MISKTTILWRTGLLGLLAIAVPGAFYWYDREQQVDTETMLDVSISIKTVSHVRIDAVGDSVWKPAAGSGFLVSTERCEVWTNHHVVADAALVEVFPRQWNSTQGIPATVVNASPLSDTAILHMQHCDNIPAARLGDSDAIKPGDEVYAVGNPLGLNRDSVSRGIISHTRRFVSGVLPFLQTDAAINPGSSGGALFNRNGEVIGMNTAIASQGDGKNLGVGYARPINLVRQENESLQHGPPSWGEAGIDKLVSELTPDEASMFRVPDGHAALIVNETPEHESPAYSLQAKDVIFELNDSEITGKDQALRMISDYGAGDTLTLQVLRGLTCAPIEITLNNGWETQDKPAPDYYAGFLGMTLQEWNDPDSKRGQFTTPVITRVHNLGPAHMASITSSQKTFARRGPFRIPVQINVETITGIVFDGTYHPVDSLKELEKYAARAFLDDSPIMLEIAMWARANPLKFDDPLEQQSTSFHKLVPALTTASTPELYGKSNVQQNVELVSDRSNDQGLIRVGMVGS